MSGGSASSKSPQLTICASLLSPNKPVSLIKARVLCSLLYLGFSKVPNPLQILKKCLLNVLLPCYTRDNTTLPKCRKSSILTYSPDHDNSLFFNASITNEIQIFNFNKT